MLRAVGLVVLATTVTTVIAAVQLDAPNEHLNWTNVHGGPIVDGSDPINRWIRSAPPAPAPVGTAAALHPHASPFSYTMAAGFLETGNDIKQLQVTSLQQALDACSLLIMCRGFTYQGGVNGTITRSTKVFLKSGGGRGGGAPWYSWYKSAPVDPPAAIFTSPDNTLTFALRTDTATVQWLNLTRGDPRSDSFSFVPALSPGSALPPVQHLGDITIRTRSAPNSSWDFFASAWGPFSATAKASPLRKNELAAHDISPLLAASSTDTLPVSIRRSYAVDAKPGVTVAFEITNSGKKPVEIGGLGMSAPASVSQDVHIGGGKRLCECKSILREVCPGLRTADCN